MDKISRGDKIAHRHKETLHEDTFARRDEIAQRWNCTKTILLKQTILHGEIFALLDIFLINIFIYYKIYFTTTVTPNPYFQSVNNFFIFNLYLVIFMFFVVLFSRAKKAFHAKLTLSAFQNINMVYYLNKK